MYMDHMCAGTREGKASVRFPEAGVTRKLWVSQYGCWKPNSDLWRSWKQTINLPRKSHVRKSLKTNVHTHTHTQMVQPHPASHWSENNNVTLNIFKLIGLNREIGFWGILITYTTLVQWFFFISLFLPTHSIDIHILPKENINSKPIAKTKKKKKSYTLTRTH